MPLFLIWFLEGLKIRYQEGPGFRGSDGTGAQLTDPETAGRVEELITPEMELPSAEKKYYS